MELLHVPGDVASGTGGLLFLHMMRFGARGLDVQASLLQAYACTHAR